MKCICIGRNYAQHAKELGNAIPTEPVLFIKPETAILSSTVFSLPKFSKDIHYEAELIFKIGKKANNISSEQALDIISDVSVGIDFTARDLQSNLKKQGYPWEIAKAFDGSAAIGTWKKFVPEELSTLDFSLNINGETVQKGNPSQMIFSVAECIAYASRFFTWESGDILFSGTPEGVGAVHSGDVLTAQLLQEEVLRLAVE